MPCVFVNLIKYFIFEEFIKSKIIQRRVKLQLTRTFAIISQNTAVSLYWESYKKTTMPLHNQVGINKLQTTCDLDVALYVDGGVRLCCNLYDVG